MRRHPLCLGKATKTQALLLEATTNRWWNLRSRLVRFSNIFWFSPRTYLEKCSKLMSIFFKWVGKKHPLEISLFFLQKMVVSHQGAQWKTPFCQGSDGGLGWIQQLFLFCFSESATFNHIWYIIYDISYMIYHISYKYLIDIIYTRIISSLTRIKCQHLDPFSYWGWSNGFLCIVRRPSWNSVFTVSVTLLWIQLTRQH